MADNVGPQAQKGGRCTHQMSISGSIWGLGSHQSSDLGSEPS
jgi:hypothetical protein